MSRPNILLVMTDQQRRDTLGWGITPALGRLAEQGVRFDAAVCDNPLCTPSRASILTGRRVAGHSVLRVHDVLPDDELLVSERLRRAGYRTGLIGKLHVCGRVAEEARRHPADGFETYEWSLEASVSLDSPFNGYAAWLRERAPDFLEALRAGGRGVLHHPEALHFSTWVAERTMAFLDAQDGRPFFCMMSLFDPHDPYEDFPESARAAGKSAAIPPPVPPGPAPHTVEAEREGSYLGRFGEFSAGDIRRMRQGYAAKLAFADRQIGRVLAHLDRLGLAERTLVIFLSDHGDQLGDHGLLVKGAALYEPTAGIPLILRWPGRLAPGVVDGPVQGRDVAATCLAAAGLDPGLCPEARDLTAIAGGAPGREVASCVYRNSGIGDDGAFRDPPLHVTMVRDRRWKLILHHRAGAPDMAELFDLSSDPQERRNLIGHPEGREAEARLWPALARELQAEAAELRPRASALPGAAQMLDNRMPLAGARGG